MKSRVEDRSPGDGFYFSLVRWLPEKKRPEPRDWLSWPAPGATRAESRQGLGHVCQGCSQGPETRKEKTKFWAQSKRCQGRRDDQAVKAEATGGAHEQGFRAGQSLRETGGWSTKRMELQGELCRADLLHPCLPAGQARGGVCEL